MSVLCLVEYEGPAVPGLSLQALTFARSLAEQGDGRLGAVVVGEPDPEAVTRLAAHGVTDLHVVVDDRLDGFAARAWAQATRQVADSLEAAAVVAPGSDRGHDVLAHLAALSDLPMAAGCLTATVGDGGLELTRIRWAGSLLEEAVLAAPRALLAVAPQLVPATTVDTPADIAVHHHSPTLEPADLVGQVVSTVPREAGSISLSDARVVVGGGRGVGGAEEFAVLEELAALLGGTVGGSRVVTSLGWRPHRDQVGQTGTRIAPELYLACGISGAIQHMAGCKSAKHLLAVNTDPDAPIMRSADYAVIGDLHEVLPAVVKALRALPG
jgi:electron transfer flavoprotein alpha subunit